MESQEWTEGSSAIFTSARDLCLKDLTLWFSPTIKSKFEFLHL